DAARSPAQAAASRTVGGSDALLALLGVDDRAERRRRSVARGRAALDALDELKVALLAGGPGSAMLNRLRALSQNLKETSGESGLDAVLAEIELRVEVEIAKLAPR
ncbi:MAG: flagellar assembly protein FliX, partial [Steroidobacteraceae bacterium]